MVAQDPAAPQLVAAVFGTSVASERTICTRLLSLNFSVSTPMADGAV